jgi:probable HAF family extracellular repeat protein
MRWKRLAGRRAIGAIGVFALFALTGARLNASDYRSIDIPGATATYCSGINDAGTIVGSYTTTTGSFGFILSTSGKVTTLTFPGAAETEANAINNSGKVVGRYVTSGGVQHGFMYAAHVFTAIDVPGSISTSVTGLARNGYMVGYFKDPASSTHGFIRSPSGTFETIDAPGGATLPYGINSAKQIVGPTWLLAAGVFSPLNLGGASTITLPRFISDALQIVGTFWPSLGGDPRGYISAGTSVTFLDYPGTVYGTSASAINRSGVVVGYYVDMTSRPYGFIWTP